VGKPDRSKQLARSRHRWKDNIKRDFQDIECGVDSIDMDQDTNNWPAIWEYVNESSGFINVRNLRGIHGITQ
jgi:hypothetical protein